MAEGVDAQNTPGEQPASKTDAARPLPRPEHAIGSSSPHAPSNPEAREQEGLRVNFVINNRHLIAHTVSSMDQSRFSSQEHREDIVAFQNFAWGASERCYDFIAGRLPPEQFFASGGTFEEVNAFLLQMEQSSEFGKIRKQTEEYFEFVRTQWERNYPQTSQAIQELTGLDLNKQVTVNVTHPSLRNGQYMGNDTIAWGHHEEWDNYSTVYLWHEILHSYLNYTDLSHAFIQLVTDNELRVRLNEGETYPPFVGHENLIPLMDKLLPYWRVYLAETPEGRKRDLLAFEERLRVMPDFREKPEEPKERPETKIIE